MATCAEEFIRQNIRQVIDLFTDEFHDRGHFRRSFFFSALSPVNSTEAFSWATGKLFGRADLASEPSGPAGRAVGIAGRSNTAIPTDTTQSSITRRVFLEAQLTEEFGPGQKLLK